MVNVVDNVGAVAAADASVRATARKPVTNERDIARDIQAAADKTAEQVIEKKSDVGSQPISPRITQDALAGTIVTEFSNAQGDVTQQLPSRAALAYLRAGLTAQGAPKEDVQEG